MALTSLHIQVTPPKPWSARKASLIHAGNDEQGQELALRAREGGPFPSRFETGDWSGAQAVEQEILSLGNPLPPAYVPSLRALENNPFPGKVRLAAEALAMLPKHAPGIANDPAPARLRLAPVIRPLYGARVAEISSGMLPSFDQTVNTSVEWRFLIELDATGNVRESVSLSGMDEEGLSSVTSWLRSVSFKPDPKKASRWIVIDVGFINQTEDESINR